MLLPKSLAVIPGARHKALAAPIFLPSVLVAEHNFGILLALY
jgi:hypothetical protein